MEKYIYGAKLLRVVDGDTADVMIDLGFDTWVKARLRFKGVDTWEKRTRDLDEKAKGIEASAFTQEYLEKNDGSFNEFFVQDGTVEFFKNILVLLSSSVENVKNLSKEFIENLSKDTQNKLSDDNITDHDRYVLNHQLETLKEIKV